MQVVLIGFMGVGKTALGRRVAQKLQREFIDIDQEIEKRERIPISKIFQLYGEAHFRNLEQSVLAEFLENNRSYLVSTGGGLPCFYDNMELINEKHLSIYLKASAEDLFERLKTHFEKRPLLNRFSLPEMKSFIEDKLNEREPYYDKAKMIIKLDMHQSKDENAEVLYQKIKAHFA